jgi:ketosteroid isomerase-like protein
MRHAGASVAILLLALTGCGMAPASSETAATPAGRETVEQVEHRRFAAMVAQDIAALEPMLAEELSYTHSTGQAENKAQFLETIRSGRLRYLAFDVKQLDVRRYGDLALLTGRLTAQARAGDQALELDVRFTDAYVDRDGRWQLAAWQSTRVQ